MNNIPNKKLTDKELAEIVLRLVFENLHIDDAELYQQFLIELAHLLTIYLGGDVVSGGHDPVCKSWQVIISHSEEVPAGGILCDYDKEHVWPEEDGPSDVNSILNLARQLFISRKSQGWTREMFVNELDNFLSMEGPSNHISIEYLAVWGEGYIEKGQPTKTETVTREFFTKDRGYNEEEIRGVFNLSVGESCQFYENGFHSVVRIS